MAKETIIKMKRELKYGKIYLPMIPWTRVWSTKCIKNSHNSTSGRKTIQLKNWHRTWTDTSPWRHTKSPETYERMLNISSYQRDASENHNEIPLHTNTGQNGHDEQINKQVLVRLWRKANPSALLVEMQTGADTVENSMEFPQKNKNGTAFRSSNSTAGIIC